MRVSEAGSTDEALRVAQSREIIDAITDLMRQAEAISHSIAEDLGLTPPDLFALIKLEAMSPGVGLPMKELAHRMGCDASFITVIADSLEAHGFLRREPGQRDRRVKNLVLTAEGVAARERLMTELAARMPWRAGLDDTERGCLAALLRKMVAGTSGEPGAHDEGHSARPTGS
jgi:MarR family transcriptional regulator, organic hydroperoxide resistance regulator